MLKVQKANLLNLKSNNIIAEGFELEKSTKLTVDKLIRNWVGRIQDVMFYPGRLRYKVRFQRFSESRLVLCNLELRLKFRKWTASATDPTVLGALNNAIENLRMSTTNGENSDVVSFDAPVDTTEQASKTATA